MTRCASEANHCASTSSRVIAMLPPASSPHPPVRLYRCLRARRENRLDRQRAVEAWVEKRTSLGETGRRSRSIPRLLRSTTDAPEAAPRPVLEQQTRRWPAGA